MILSSFSFTCNLNNKIDTSVVNSMTSSNVIINKPVKMCKYLEHISTCTRPVDTKHGKVVTYREGFPLIKSHNPLN